MWSMKKTSETSPVLFLNVKGEPMRFFLRPGPTKVQLQPLITTGGGVLCRTQEPSAVLLADPGEISAVGEAASQFYISTQYIRDCILHNQQLDIESYRFSNLLPVQTRMAVRKQKGVGRMGYSLEDDSAILKFIAKRQHDAKGNRVWKEMERQGITSHSWQSMKDRFLKHLHQKLPSKSFNKDVKVCRTMTSPSSVNDTPHPSSDTTVPPKSKVRIISESDSDGSRPADQPEPEPSPEKCSSAERPDSDTNQTRLGSNDGQNEPQRDQNQESAQEKEQQECPQDDHEVAAKKARMENDESGTGSSHEHPTTSSAKEKQRKEKKGRKTGILERAAREFEDSQRIDSQEDQPESQPTSSTSETNDAPTHEETIGEHAQIRHHLNTEPHEPETQNTFTLGSEDSIPGPSGALGPVTSNTTYMFLHQQESQEDLSQPSEEEHLSQDLLETKRHVISLMQESGNNLVEVMKALLKASGDVTLANLYLVDGRDPNIHGPLWTKKDDELLLSADLHARKMLNEKFGAEQVSRRIAFLRVE